MTSLILSLKGGQPDFDQIYSATAGQAIEVQGIKSCKQRWDNLYIEFINDEALEKAFQQCGWAKESYTDSVKGEPVAALKARLVPGADDYDDACYVHCQIQGTHLFFGQWDLTSQ